MLTKGKIDELGIGRGGRGGGTIEFERKESLGWKPLVIDACDLLVKDFPEPKWAIPGLIPEGVTLLAGKPKLGKSWMALGFGIAIAAGGKALGQIEIQQGECLYLALEDNERRLKKRLKVLNPNGDHMPPGLHLTTEWRRVDDGGLDDLREWLTEHKDCRLVMIDTLQKIRASRGNRDTYEADYEVGASLQEIAHKFNIAILVIHHLRKMDSEDPMDQISGTTGLTGGVDGSLVLMRRRGETDAVLHVTGRDIEDDTPLALNWDAKTATWQTTGPAAMECKTGVRTDTSQFIENNGPSTAEQISAGTGETLNTVQKRLKRMYDDGELIRTGNNKAGYRYMTPGVACPSIPSIHTSSSSKYGSMERMEGFYTPCKHCGGEGCDWCD